MNFLICYHHRFKFNVQQNCKVRLACFNIFKLFSNPFNKFGQKIKLKTFCIENF